MLQQQSGLLHITLLEYLQDKYDKFYRTLQRRIKQWHALNGGDQETMSLQQQQPSQ